jgi:hypothetical protein
LKQEAPDAFQALPPAVWSNWASIILAYPFSTESDDTDLVRLALEQAPGPFLEALSALIDLEVRDDGRLRVLDRLGDAWTPALAEALAAKLDDSKLPVRAMGHLLDILLDHDVPEARGFAAALVARSLEKGTIPSNRIVAAGRALLTHARDGGWEILWPRFDQDPVFGQGVIAAVVDFHPVEDTIAKRLTEEQLGRLYVWLERHYPHAEDPDVSGVHAMGQREHIAHWRDDILNYLRQHGTPAAYATLEEIQRALPELHWLTWTLVEARDVLRRREWIPPLPQHVIRLAFDREKRLVQSGRDLLDVLVETLKGLERELHGETPTVQFLWDTWGFGHATRRRPKEENALSDFVKSHLDRELKERGVIVNREVEIRRRIGASPGERTDIHVDAVMRGAARDSYDTISVIIETKGSWNRELRTAMKSQLVDRYLSENRCRFGLYLVGWFNCDAWDPDDSRLADAGTWTSAEARAFLEEQAAQLSTGNMDIRAVVLDAKLP